ncbi:uncharacterized protein MELLADRAFT_111223 [Melampsora larici-populina 98AG31]|uniref:Uncharacterized protein n=1 Tax=Melampsora larici-populina (strain 98AG31 / pathotype 3-4-7) TaxID=747676 RepID=F4S2F8_MELLP|nr:uncharacterized protein MELLADRAFT_111223 [Melampsora larici-populina 98AG31]EGG01211.1 hypothetical protein MELLADRAFT_111223 [Melampsora larici-populina 98AG31]
MVISKRTHNTTSSISQSNHHHHHQQPHQQSDRKLRALKNCSKWNSALLQGRRSRGPQWDYSTASYHIPRNSIAYLTGVTPLDHQSLTQSTSTHQTNQIKPSSPYLSNPSSQSQPHSINSTSTHLLRSSSASIHQLQPIQRPSPHPHPHHQLQSKPSNTLLHDPKFPPFVSVSNHHLPQSNLSTHPGPIPAPSSHFSSTSVSSSTGTHPSGAGPGAGAHLTTRHQISPTGLPHQEQKNEVHPESNHDPSIHGESNLSRHSSIDKSQVHPHPPAPASIRSNASELGSNQTQAYPAFHPSEPSPQFQTQHQPTPLQYPPAPPPPHLIPPPTSPDKLTNQLKSIHIRHPPQLSPIPPPTPQDQF